MLKPDTASGPTLATTTAKLVRNQSSSRSFFYLQFCFCAVCYKWQVAHAAKDSLGNKVRWGGVAWP